MPWSLPPRLACWFSRSRSTPGHKSVRASLVYEVCGKIWRANVNGSHPVQLTSGTDPQISPDGRLVAFVRVNTDENDTVFVMPTVGGKAGSIR